MKELFYVEYWSLDFLGWAPWVNDTGLDQHWTKMIYKMSKVFILDRSGNDNAKYCRNKLHIVYAFRVLSPIMFNKSNRLIIFIHIYYWKITYTYLKIACIVIAFQRECFGHWKLLMLSYFIFSGKLLGIDSFPLQEDSGGWHSRPPDAPALLRPWAMFSSVILHVLINPTCLLEVLLFLIFTRIYLESFSRKIVIFSMFSILTWVVELTLLVGQDIVLRNISTLPFRQPAIRIHMCVPLKTYS